MNQQTVHSLVPTSQVETKPHSPSISSIPRNEGNGGVDTTNLLIAILGRPAGAGTGRHGGHCLSRPKAKPPHSLGPRRQSRTGRQSANYAWQRAGSGDFREFLTLPSKFIAIPYKVVYPTLTIKINNGERCVQTTKRRPLVH